MHLKVINLDNSLTSQVALKNATTINALSFASKTRIFARKKTIYDFIQHIGQPPQNEPEIIFYGSGDFHHLTAALISRHTEPLTVIHFDNHPDWVKFPATYNCGAWVNRALDMPHVKKMITLGVNSKDLENPERKYANLQALNNGTLQLYPWSQATSCVKGSYGFNDSYQQLGNYINWKTLSTKIWPDFAQQLIKTVFTEAIYITIDKDVLGSNEATTNWDQGSMPLAYITSMIKTLSKKFKILGIDVCGDYSRPKFADPFRFALAYFDHPKKLDPGREQLYVNDQANQTLIKCFESL